MSEDRRQKGDGSIYQREDGLWVGSLDLGTSAVTGKRKRKVVYGSDRAEVEEKLVGLRKKNPTQIEAEEMSMKNSLDLWLDSHIKVQVSPPTYARYRRTVKPLLIPYLGHFKIGELTAYRIAEGYRKMEADGISGYRRRLAGKRLRQFLGYAMRMGVVSTNEAMKIPLVPDRPKEIKPLSADQVGVFLKEAEADRLHALYVLAIDSGCRMGELLGLEWTDFGDDLATVFITKSLVEDDKGHRSLRPVKTKKGRRRIPLSPETAAALREHQARMEEEGHRSRIVFCGRKGEYILRSNLRRQSFYPILERAGLDIRFHDLRHSCATLLLMANVHAKVISERLGHATVSITLDLYAHCLPGMQGTAVDAMSKVLATRTATLGSRPSLKD